MDEELHSGPEESGQLSLLFCLRDALSWDVEGVI